MIFLLVGAPHHNAGPTKSTAAVIVRRQGQLVILFLLSYLVLSYFLCSLAEWLAFRLPVMSRDTARKAVAYVVVVVVSPMVLFQSFAQ